MTLDWVSLESFLVDTIVSSVRAVADSDSEATICRAAITDFYAQNLLVLWPTVAVSTDRSGWQPAEWRWQFDADRAGDEWASRVTAHAGSSGNRWADVIDRFFDVVVSACRTATIVILDEAVVEPGFVVVAIDERRDLAERCLTSAQLEQNFPRIHRRNNAVREIQGLTVDHQIDVLLAGLTRPESDSALDVTDCIRLLVDIGEGAAVAAAELIGVSDVSLQALTQVIDEIGGAAPRIVNPLAGLVRDTSRDHAVRRSAACSLAWVGRLDLVIDSAADLSDDTVLAAMATPYLSEIKNGALDYRPIESALDVVPHVHDRLFARLSPTHIHHIDAADMPTAMAALSSRWPLVRRHAAIVMLSVHL